jgi:uncharacterized protein
MEQVAFFVVLPLSRMKGIFWNQAEARPRAFWRLVAHILLVLFFVSVFSFALMAVMAEWPAIVAGSVLGTILATWIAVRWLDRRPFRDLGFRVSPAWWLDLAFGTVLGLALMTLLFLVQYELGWVQIVGTMVTRAPDTNAVLALAVGLLMMAGVGLYEEIILRGYQLTNVAEGLEGRRLDSRMAVVASLLITSLLFGLAHGLNPNASAFSTANISLAGLVLGLAFVVTGRLALPIGLHFSWNAAQGLIFGFPVSGLTAMFDVQVLAIEQTGPERWTGGAFGPEAGLLSTGILVVGGLLIIAWARAHEGRVDPHEQIALPPLLRPSAVAENRATLSEPIDESDPPRVNRD